MLLLFLVLLIEFLLDMQQVTYTHIRIAGSIFNNQNYKTVNYMRSRIAGLIT